MLHVHREPRPGGPSRGDGLAFIRRNNVKAHVHPLATSIKVESFEQLQVVKLTSSSSSFVVLNIYRSPSCSISLFLEELADTDSTICAFSDDSLPLCGDLNCPGVDSSSVDDGLAAVLDSLGLELLVDKPIRENNLLDIVATEAPGAFSAIHVDDTGCLSDHRLIRIRLVFGKPLTGAVESTYRNIRKIDFSSFEKILRESPLFTSPANTADAFAAQVADVVSAELDKVAPSGNVSGAQLSQLQSSCHPKRFAPNVNVGGWRNVGLAACANRIASRTVNAAAGRTDLSTTRDLTTTRTRSRHVTTPVCSGRLLGIY